ncbi:DDE-type integrase/transposase/recombinase [Streptomyces sp. NPDC058864]
MNRPVPHQDLLLPFTVSIGAAHTTDLPNHDYSALLHAADVAMYQVRPVPRHSRTWPPPRTVPELVANGPSQVFTWDITRLPGPAKGIWYHAYVIIDIFSRYIVGHTVELAETAERAEELIRDAIERNGIVPETVHADPAAPP